MSESICNWREDKDGNWESDCGQVWYFLEYPSKPSENKMHFCHTCGKDLIEHVYIEDEDSE